MAEEQNPVVEEQLQAAPEVTETVEIPTQEDVPAEVSPLDTTEVIQETDEDTPPVKKTPNDFILERLAKKKKEAQDEAEVLKQRLADLENQKSTEQLANEATNELVQQNQQLQRQIDVRRFVEEQPDFKKYEEKMNKWSEHPSYANIPVQQLAFAVAGTELIRVGANQAAQADMEAASTHVSGNVSLAQTNKTPKLASEMTDEEFEAEVKAIKRKGFN